MKKAPKICLIIALVILGVFTFWWNYKQSQDPCKICASGDSRCIEERGLCLKGEDGGAIEFKI
jgi:hypothetical protein